MFLKITFSNILREERLCFAQDSALARMQDLASRMMVTESFGKIGFFEPKSLRLFMCHEISPNHFRIYVGSLAEIAFWIA